MKNPRFFKEMKEPWELLGKIRPQKVSGQPIPSWGGVGGLTLPGAQAPDLGMLVGQMLLNSRGHCLSLCSVTTTGWQAGPFNEQRRGKWPWDTVHVLTPCLSPAACDRLYQALTCVNADSPRAQSCSGGVPTSLSPFLPHTAVSTRPRLPQYC